MDTQVRFSSRLAQVVRPLSLKVVRPLSLVAAALAIAGAAPTTAHAIAYAEADLFASITVESIRNLTNPGDLWGLSVSFPEYMNYPETSDCLPPPFGQCGTLGPSSVDGENSVTENAVTATGRAELTVLASPSLVGGYISPWRIGMDLWKASDDAFEVTVSYTVDVTTSASLTPDFVGEIVGQVGIENVGEGCLWGETTSYERSGTVFGTASARAYAPGARYDPSPSDPTYDAEDGFSGHWRETVQLYPGSPSDEPACSWDLRPSLDIYASLEPNPAFVVPAPGAAAAVPAFALLLVAVGRRRPTT